MSSDPKASVIISVYNHFEWLRLILDALRMQSRNDFEVIIADDGSDDATVTQIKKYISGHPELTIKHIWHPDDGWRKEEALNNAVRAARGEWLLFLDGDCVPHPRWADDHLRLLRPGTAIAGRRMDLPKDFSDSLTDGKDLPENWLRLVRGNVLKGLPGRPLSESMRMLRRSTRLPMYGDKSFMPKKGGILGCNFSIAKKDLEAVNGFDERYRAPGTGEDTDLELRLSNAGIDIKRVSHNALTFHRHHPRLDMSSEENARLLQEARENHTAYTPHGINRDAGPNDTHR